MAVSTKFSLFLITGIAIGMYPVKYFVNGPVCTSTARLDGKVAIITGANTGLGKETAIDFLNRGARVVMGCRSMVRCKDAAADMLNVTGVPTGRLVTSYIDLSSFDSIRVFAKQFSYNESRLDILVNNAGIAFQPNDLKSEDNYDITFAVNHLGPFLLTNLLMKKLVESAPSRVITLSSVTHFVVQRFDFDVDYAGDHDLNGYVNYAYSKLANILFSRELGKRLGGTGVTSYVIHPGVLITDIVRDLYFMDIPFLNKLLKIIAWPFTKDLYHGTQTQICCAVDPNLGAETGKYYVNVAVAEPSSGAQNDEDAIRLWNMSVQMVKLSEEEIHAQLL